MNVGHEEEELKPYSEPELDLNDAKRIGKYLRSVRASVTARGSPLSSLAVFTGTLKLKISSFLISFSYTSVLLFSC